MHKVSLKPEDNEWNLKLGELAMIWREGCIIRAQFTKN